MAAGKRTVLVRLEVSAVVATLEGDTVTAEAPSPIKPCHSLEELEAFWNDVSEQVRQANASPNRAARRAGK